MKNISRRNFLKGSLVLSAVAAMGGPSAALAEETAATFADLIKWDAEYDVIVMGMGAAGLAAAKGAASSGAHVLLTEKMNEGKAGGNSKVSGQMFAYAHGEKESAKEYYKTLCGGRHLPEEMLDVMAENVANIMDILADEFGFNKEEMVDHQNDMKPFSPEYPEFEGGEKLSICSLHNGFSDSYLYNSMKQVVESCADMVDIWYESPAKKLIQDPDTKIIVGVQIERGGVLMNVRAFNGVVIATGGFEANPDMMQQYLDVINYAPRGGQYNTGDGIRMAQEVGADLWHMKAFEGLFGFGNATWPEKIGTPCAQPVHGSALSTGASILVGTDGDRFLNETEGCRHGHMYHNGVWENPTYPQKMWHIFDKTQKDLIFEGNLIPEAHIADVKEFDTIEEMAAAIGCPADRLKRTIENFNTYTSEGFDPVAGRAPETMRAFDGVKYYAEYMVNGILNTQGGPRRNEKAEVLNLQGNPIPHLYSAGECGGFTVCMYQGGSNISECIIFGLIAGKNAAVVKAPLPNYEPGKPIESNPAKPGEITDIGAVTEYDTAENEYVTTGSGMMGDVTVRTKIVDGKIVNVEVLEHYETQNIGTLAAERIPEKFIGLSTAEEVDAVDSVTGATITSNALKNAVKAALELAK